MDCSDEERDFFLLALTDTLRTASKAGTGWPYIAPSKYHEKQERDAIEVFCRQVQVMYKDLLVRILLNPKALIWPLRHRLISTTTTTLTEQDWRCIFLVGPSRGETSLSKCETNLSLRLQRKSAVTHFQMTR